MGNQKKQKSTSQGFSFVNLSLIDKSSFNPRKNFNEDELKELSLSIKEKGVIQPIVIRPVGQRFELVCGERRCRASLLAGLETIPSWVKDLSDDEAEELAITENLQRKDVAPMEEARAFVRLVDKGKYDVADLAKRFGKSESFIRNRMKLTQLSEKFMNLLEQDFIALGVANVLANCDMELQETIFTDHFSENCAPYASWLNHRPNQLQKAVEERYSTKLTNYQFNKEECKNCPFNSTTFSLFVQDGDEGKCMKKSCLQKKNSDYFYDLAIELQKQNPLLSYCCDTTWATNSALVDRLVENGFEVSRTNLVATTPYEEPIVPLSTDFNSADEYENAVEEYNEDLKDFKKEMDELDERLGKGEIKACIAIMVSSVFVSFAEVEELHEQPENNDTAANATVSMQSVEVAKLLNKKNRNNELCVEKIVADEKELIKRVEIAGDVLSFEEWALALMFMVRKMSDKAYAALNFKKEKYMLSYTDLINLSEEKKAIIIRGYIVPNLVEQYVSSSVNEEYPLRVFLMQHAAENTEKIKNEWEITYRRRNERLDERINELRNEDVSDSLDEGVNEISEIEDGEVD